MLSGISPWSILLILIIVIVLFGTKKLRNVGADLGSAIKSLIVDTMIACSLLDENRFSYTLNTLSWHFLNEGKNERALNEAAKSRGLDAKAVYDAEVMEDVYDDDKSIYQRDRKSVV